MPLGVFYSFALILSHAIAIISQFLDEHHYNCEILTTFFMTTFFITISSRTLTLNPFGTPSEVSLGWPRVILGKKGKVVLFLTCYLQPCSRREAKENALLGMYVPLT